MPFTIYWRSWREGPTAALKDSQLRALLAFGLTVSMILFLWSSTGSGTGWIPRLGNAVLTGFSAQTTTGFHTMPPGDLSAGPKLVVILSMLVGGSAGSTAGGIKLVRILLFFRVLRLTLARTALPQHAVAEEGEAGGASDPGEIRGALLMVVLFATAMAVSWLAFLASGHAPLDSLFDVASALGTVGLSTGVTGPSLEWGFKLVLCADMLLGRLEFVALLVLFYPPTWIGSRRSAS
jgi:trk system potassium uptake protein TrkH